MTDVLVVDDDRQVAEGIRLRLAGAGYDAIVASDGTAAIRAFRAHRPTLVLLDASMPDVSGYDVCQEICALDTDHATSVVFISGASNPSPEYVERCAKLIRCDGFLRKPYEPRQLLALVEKRLGGPAERRDAARALHGRVIRAGL